MANQALQSMSEATDVNDLWVPNFRLAKQIET
jgi:hypothetical protein